MGTKLSSAVFFNEWPMEAPSDYHVTFSLKGLPVMSDMAWEKLKSWLVKHVEVLAKSSCE